jgi:hypothetical protein
MTTPPFKTTAMAAIAAIALLGQSAFAQTSPSGDMTFTFTSTSNPLNNIGGDGKNGVPYSGSSWTGSTTGMMADGRKLSSTFSCVMMSQPPNDTLFQTHALCDIKSADGTYSVAMGCELLNPATMEASCIGALYGTGGAYAGKRGSVTNHVKSGVAHGTGQWFR